DRDRPKIPKVIATPSATKANQPSTVAGGCQFQVTTTASTSTAGEEDIEDQAISPGAVFGSVPPVRKSRGAREQPPPNRPERPRRAARRQTMATFGGCAPSISARPRNATAGAAIPSQRSRSIPVAAATSPVSSG